MRRIGDWSQIRTMPSRALLLWMLLLLALLLPHAAAAHETWVLSPEQITEWNAKPKPEIFTQLNGTNILMVLATALFLVGWILLNFTGARELFPDLQVRLASCGGYAALALRIALFVMLGMAALGLGPRHGTGMLEAPALAAPDLELRLVQGHWSWIAWVEGGVALGLLLGIYVRGAAALLLALCILGLFLFGRAMYAYTGLLGGAAVYLLLQGAGSYHVPLPTIPGTSRIRAWLADQPRARAQWLLRVLAGLNLIYLGLEYKFRQPNLILGILELHHVPTFGLEPGTFVLWMALVETLSGALILAGVLMRPLSLVLFASFAFFSVLLGESVSGHIIFYGLLVSFITNAAGRWRRPVATDRPGAIVILGGSFAGVHCAMRLERLRGDFTNVTTTLVHRESSFLFHPLLPEVVGGSVQPGNIVNPIRRLCPRTRFLQGEVQGIDGSGRQVVIRGASGEEVRLAYDCLVIAMDPEASFAGVPGLLEHALPLMTIGDGLFLRQRVLERLEQAETVGDAQQRRSLLAFAVVGGGLRGCAAAAELCELVNSAVVSYSRVRRDEFRILLFEGRPGVLPGCDDALARAAHRALQRIGVQVFAGVHVRSVTPDEVVLGSGERISSRTVVAALAARPPVLAALPGARPDGRLPVGEFLQLPADPCILVAGDCASPQGGVPFRARREIRMGRLAAYNALARTQGFRQLRWSEKRPRMSLAAMGRHATVAQCLGIPVRGIPAWLISRSFCLFTLPGLERNLRILIDWMLDIPFRSDIVVLAPERTHKLSRAHYEMGDEIVREGERGECAYLLLNGRVEVLRQINGAAERLAVLHPGECFGEIALLCDTSRTATVRCLTAVDAVVLPRDQFMTLTEGYRDLANALKARMARRMAERDAPEAPGRDAEWV